MNRKNLIRASLFIIYFWFGILKLIDASPANPLVADLLARTMPFITFGHFIICLGLFEMLIGVLFLIPRYQKLATGLFIIHMFVAAMPLILAPAMTWQSLLVPTLEGQYIIKNLALIALVANL